jgi:hypothetical protein
LRRQRSSQKSDHRGTTFPKNRTLDDRILFAFAAVAGLRVGTEFSTTGAVIHCVTAKNSLGLNLSVIVE